MAVYNVNNGGKKHKALSDKFFKLFLIVLPARRVLLFCSIGNKYVLY